MQCISRLAQPSSDVNVLDVSAYAQIGIYVWKKKRHRFRETRWQFPKHGLSQLDSPAVRGRCWCVVGYNRVRRRPAETERVGHGFDMPRYRLNTNTIMFFNMFVVSV